jgi:hypothetical protein
MVIGAHVGTGFGPSSDSFGYDVAARGWNMAARTRGGAGRVCVRHRDGAAGTCQVAGDIEERNRWQMPNG